MKKYRVIAYADEEGNTKQRGVVEAENHAEAQRKAWEMFPEHHEVGAFEIKEENQ